MLRDFHRSLRLQYVEIGAIHVEQHVYRVAVEFCTAACAWKRALATRFEVRSEVGDQLLDVDALAFAIEQTRGRQIAGADPRTDRSLAIQSDRQSDSRIVSGAIDHDLLIREVDLVLRRLNLRMILDRQCFGLLQRQHGRRLGEQCHRQAGTRSTGYD